MTAFIQASHAGAAATRGMRSRPAIQPVGKRALLILDWWEKLAGASLALSAVIRLCQATGAALVTPSVRSSLFLPGPAKGAWPLSAYYDAGALRGALAPQTLTSYAAWRQLSRHNGSRSLLLIVVYTEFPKACSDMVRTDQSTCPSACLSLSGIQRLLKAAHKWVGDGLSQMCVGAAEVRAGVAGRGRVAALIRSHHATALLNFRRHDGGRPMLPQVQAHALRSLATRPSSAVRAAAHGLLAQHHIPPKTPYASVQLRSNHLAHAAYQQLYALASSAVSTTVVSTSSATTSAASSTSTPASTACAGRVVSCARRLSRAMRRHAAASSTIVASDLATLFRPNQDGETHRRKPYMKECLVPALPALRRWYTSVGYSFNCSGAPAFDRARAARVSEGRASAADACDAGWLGLVDWTLATEATWFAAIDVRTPWRSAFLEWIVMARKAKGRASELIACP